MRTNTLKNLASNTAFLSELHRIIHHIYAINLTVTNRLMNRYNLRVIWFAHKCVLIWLIGMHNRK